MIIFEILNKLQNDLIELVNWADKWGMRFNAKKCSVMSVNCKSRHFYTLCDHILKQVEENPYLERTLTEKILRRLSTNRQRQ